MAQFVEFNEVLKVEDVGKYLVGKHYWVCRGGYKVYPMLSPIDLIDKNKDKVGKCRVKIVEVKFQEFLTDDDAKRVGLQRFTELGYFLEMENPAEGQVATFVYFERLE